MEFHTLLELSLYINVRNQNKKDMDILKEYKEKSLMLHDEFHPKFIIEIQELLNAVDVSDAILLVSEKAEVGILAGQYTDVINCMSQKGMMFIYNSADCCDLASDEKSHFSEFSCEVLIDIISSVKTHISEKEIEVMEKELKILKEKKEELQSQIEKLDIKIKSITNRKSSKI